VGDTFTTYDGSEYEVLERPAGPTDPLVMRFRLLDHCGAPPPHIHPHAREVFEVEEGSFELQLEGAWQTVSPGEAVTVEPGQSHTFRNHSGETVVVRNVHDPHHDFETYLRRIAGISHEYKAMGPSGPRPVLAMARLWQEHTDLIQPSPLPLKLAFPVLGLLARLTGTSAPSAS